MTYFNQYGLAMTEKEVPYRSENLNRRKSRQLLCASLGLAIASGCVGVRAATDLEGIVLPQGFHIELLTDRVTDAREMALGITRDARNILFVGSSGAGKVYAVSIDHGRATAVRTIAAGLQRPVGVAYRDGSLYVSAVSRILRIDKADDDIDRMSAPTVVTDHFPSETHHGWKFIAFGPDGDLYIPVGAPCNICERDENRYYNIQRIIPDPEFGNKHACSQFTPPSAKLGAHVAALGMRFYSPPGTAGEPFPESFRNGIFIAEHGSWNRSTKSGYRIVFVTVDQSNRVVGQHVFAEGWLRDDDSVSGRPADVLPLPDGSLLVSDDLAGAIYRIRYTPPR